MVGADKTRIKIDNYLPQATSPFGSQETLVQPVVQMSSTNCRGKLERSGTDDDSARDGTFTDFSCNEDESDVDWQTKVGLST